MPGLRRMYFVAELIMKPHSLWRQATTLLVPAVASFSNALFLPLSLVMFLSFRFQPKRLSLMTLHIGPSPFTLPLPYCSLITMRIYIVDLYTFKLPSLLKIKKLTSPGQVLLPNFVIACCVKLKATEQVKSTA